MTTQKEKALELFSEGIELKDVYQEFPNIPRSTIRRWAMEHRRKQQEPDPTSVKVMTDQEAQALKTEVVTLLEDMHRMGLTDSVFPAGLEPNTPTTQPQEAPMTELDRLEVEIKKLEGQIAKYSDELNNLAASPTPEPSADGRTADELFQLFQAFESAKVTRQIRLTALEKTIERLEQQKDSLELAAVPHRQQRATQQKDAAIADIEARMVPVESEILELAQRLQQACLEWRALALQGNAAWSQYCAVVPTEEFRVDKAYGLDNLRLPQIKTEGIYRRTLTFSSVLWPDQAFILPPAMRQ